MAYEFSNATNVVICTPHKPHEGWFGDTECRGNPHRYIHLPENGYHEPVPEFRDGQPVTVIRPAPPPAQIHPGTRVTVLSVSMVDWQWRACSPEACSCEGDKCQRTGKRIRQATQWILMFQSTANR